MTTKGYVKCDSRTAIRLIKNPELHRRTKHIDIRYQFIRDLFDKGKFQIQYVSLLEIKTHYSAEKGVHFPCVS